MPVSRAPPPSECNRWAGERSDARHAAMGGWNSIIDRDSGVRVSLG
jgi:hypothetical protein